MPAPSCTLSKLFWQEERMGESSCSVERCKLGDLPLELVPLILNRLTPHKFMVSEVSGLSVCSFHQDFLGPGHQAVRRKTCDITGCSSKAGPRRVTLAKSSSIFKETGQSVVTGSGLCELYRKQFTDDSSLLFLTNEVKDSPVREELASPIFKKKRLAAYSRAQALTQLILTLTSVKVPYSVFRRQQLQKTLNLPK